jgi:predicted ATP-grasp superfamily ATP-dependent carboligase
LQQIDKTLLIDLQAELTMIERRLETSETLLLKAEESLNDSLRAHRVELIKTGVISGLVGIGLGIVVYHWLE